jgi:uncharacterized membrane protein
MLAALRQAQATQAALAMQAALAAQNPTIQFGVPTQLTLPGIVQQQAQHWQGPYPPPDAVERYERVLPGTFNRLITMAEQLQAAQIEQSGRIIDLTHAENKRGHWLGFSSTVIAMAGAVVCVWMNAPWLAVAFLSVPVMAVGQALVETAKKSTGTDLIKAAAQTVPAIPSERPENATNPQAPTDTANA